MLFRVIHNQKEITVITESGGVACIREAEDSSIEEPRIAITDYYQHRLTEDSTITADNLYDCLAEGKMYHKDWLDVKYNSLTAINDALSWLVLGQTEWEISDSIFPHLFDR
jgi:hypothetical protein